MYVYYCTTTLEINSKSPFHPPCRDLRKPSAEAYSTEIDYVRNDVTGILRDFEDWARERSVKKTVVSILDRTTVIPEPYGVVLVIGELFL